MIRIFHVLSVCLIVASSATAQDQEEKHYEWIEVNGHRIRAFVPTTPDQLHASAFINASNEQIRLAESGALSILESTSLDSLKKLFDIELLDEQKDQLTNISKRYRNELASTKRGSLEEIQLRVAYARLVAEVLLPNQLAAIKNRLGDKRFLSQLLFAPARMTGVTLTENQRQKLMSLGDDAHEDISKTLKELERKKKEYQERLLKIYRKTLTAEQQAAFELNRDIKKLIDALSLENMKSDTDFKQLLDIE